MIVDKDFMPSATLKLLIEEIKKFEADVFQSVHVVKGKPDSAILVISGPNTKAYLQAIQRVDDLLKEDRDE